MFRVECTSCKAAYQVDERRVPAKGLTMKCPKCRESFLVSPPDKPAAPVEKVALPAPNNFGGTMIGVSARRDLLGGVSKAVDPNNQTQIGLAGPRGMKGNDATMIGVAPSSAGAVPKNTSADLPAVRDADLHMFSKTGRTQDLPVSSPPGPVSHAPNTQDTAAELPAIKGSKAPAPGTPFAAVTSKKTSRINLSSLSQPSRPEATKSEPFKLETPKAEAVKPDYGAFEPSRQEPLRGETRIGEPFNTRSKPGALGPSNRDLAVTEAELPAVASKTAKSAPDLADALLDLPAVIGTGKSEPLRSQQSAPPSGRLFKPTSPELPAVKSKPPEIKEGHASLFDLDLPAVFSDRGSKSGTSPTGSSATAGASTKSVSPVSLSPSAPSVARSSTTRPPSADEVVDLDSEALESLAPSRPPQGPKEADLPEVAGLDLPDVLGGTALPALPTQFDDAGLGFGELDLPTIGGGRAGSELPPLASFGERLPSFAPSEPPAGRVSSQPPSFRARQDSFGDFDGVPSFAPSTKHPTTVGNEAAHGDFDDGLLDGESFALGGERHSVSEFGSETRAASQPPGPSVQRGNVQRGNVEEYGQVTLEGGGDADDEMEFGGIPQADSEPPKGAVALDGRAEAGAPMEPVVAPTAAVRPKVTKGKADVKKTRGSVKIAAVAVVLLAVGGGALALEPDIGPFGFYAAQDLFLRGEHQALQTRLNQSVEAARALDGYAAAVAAVKAMDEGRASAKRFVPLKADTASQALALALRFGGPASLQSTGQVLVNELLASSAERAELRRAQVVDHVLKRQPNVPSELAALSRDLFTLTVEGEHWLRVENVDNATSSWMEAVNQKRCAWTVFGLARSYLAANQLEKALDAAKQALELNPDHVGAKLLQVDAAIRGGTFEPSVVEALQSVSSASAIASPSEVTLAHTLRGEFEFGTGKTSSALESFDKALEVVPGDARALTSSAGALFASGRHAAALARYQAAVTAAPESLAPQVGVARTQLALDQLDQAVLLIQTLRQAYPKDLEVAYVSGMANLTSGNVEVGRRILQEAIDLSKLPAPPRLAPRDFQRVAVEAYVALATSFTKTGEPERAAPILAQAAAELPGSSALRVATGDVAFGQGQFEKALAEYSEARKLTTSDSAAVFKEGQALSRLRRFDEAQASFDRVAEIDVNYPGLPLERGLILDKSGKAAEALAEYERALKHDPNDVDIQLRVGCGRVEAAQGASAATVLKDVLVKRPHSAEANYCLGRALFAQGSTVEALRLMRAAVEYDSNSPLYRLHLGWIASEMGQVAVARRELNRALELDQGAVDAYWQRGVLNLKQGAARDATVDFRKALELNPAHLGANADMAQALAQLGKEGDAMPFWERAIAGDANNSVWLFRYGKVLVGRNQREKGTELLLRALKVVDGQSPAPNWLWQAHYLVALGLTGNADAVRHWRRYLELSPHDSPYRGEAKRALAKAGQPWDGQ